MLRVILHPFKSWNLFRTRVYERLTPSAEEMRAIHEQLHSFELAHWYSGGKADAGSSADEWLLTHTHSWRCVHCREHVAQEVMMVCTDCARIIPSSGTRHQRYGQSIVPQEIAV